ncbi:copper resistance protein [Pantoea dispersa]|nr:copper resistance protein [Pantoea dispersa]
MSIKNDGHYCPATGDNRTDGLHEPLTFISPFSVFF